MMINLEDLRNATGGQLFGSAAAQRFNGLCHNVRQIQPGQLYVALKTGHRDGHVDIEEAIARGAGGILCQEPPVSPSTDVTVILVGDTAAALRQWVSYILRKYGTTIVAISGAFGKSSTRHAIAAVLGTRYRVYTSQQARDETCSLPFTFDQLTPDHQVVLVELVTDDTYEITDLLSLIQPHVGVITNIAPAEVLENWDVAQTNALCRHLLEILPENGMAVLNFDDELVGLLKAYTQAGTINYGIGAGQRDLSASNIQFFADKMGFDLNYGDELHRGRWIPTLGYPGLYSSLAALATGVVFDIPLKDGLRALTNLQALPGHLNLLDGTKGSLLIDDTYDGTPTSAEAALEILSKIDIGNARRTFVLGDLTCHPEAAARAEREIGRKAAYSVDLFVSVGEQAARSIQVARRTGLPEEQTIITYRPGDAANLLQAHVQRGDVVLITGGKNARMERVAEQLLGRVADRARLPRQEIDPGSGIDQRPGWPTWIELDLDAVAHNIRSLKRRVGQQIEIMALVEGNGYGHGAAPIASTAINNGAAMLGVASVQEGYRLRMAGINAPTLVLGYTPPWEFRHAIMENIDVTLYNLESAKNLERTAHDLKQTARVHVHVDVGLGQLGLLPEDAIRLIRQIVRLDALQLAGVYTHFSQVENLSFAPQTEIELERFTAVVANLKATGIDIPYIHAAGTAATLTMPESHFTMVRAGLATYGISPSEEIGIPNNFRRALAWKSQVAQVRTLPEGWFTGYGSAYQVPGEDRIAVLPVGYADGYRNTPNRSLEVLIHGQRTPVIGRIAMSQCVVYISHIPNVQVSDEAVLIGQQGDETITVEEVARQQGITSYELLTGISEHIPRVI